MFQLLFFNFVHLCFRRTLSFVVSFWAKSFNANFVFQLIILLFHFRFSNFGQFVCDGTHGRSFSCCCSIYYTLFVVTSAVYNEFEYGLVHLSEVHKDDSNYLCLGRDSMWSHLFSLGESLIKYRMWQNFWLSWKVCNY